MRPILVAALLPLLAACASVHTPAESLRLAEEELASGATRSGVRRMERALVALDERDPQRWDHLGALAIDVDRDVARRARDRAESLAWPDATPRHAVRLHLPFMGRWWVTQGNRGDFSHMRLADRFAWDFQAVDARGWVSIDGSDNLDAFYGFGAPVFAPADGVVERAQDGVPDNVAGRRNYERPGGNVVVIRHAAGEMSHFCHLKSGSIVVRPGQSITRGEMIGRCGSSGNAVEPHLHFVLRRGPTSEDMSIPARFDDVSTWGRAPSSETGVPGEGDYVEPRR